MEMPQGKLGRQLKLRPRKTVLTQKNLKRMRQDLTRGVLGGGLGDFGNVLDRADMVFEARKEVAEGKRSSKSRKEKGDDDQYLMQKYQSLLDEAHQWLSQFDGQGNKLNPGKNEKREPDQNRLDKINACYELMKAARTLQSKLSDKPKCQDLFIRLEELDHKNGKKGLTRSEDVEYRQVHSSILVQCCEVKPPSSKGASDSFFLSDWTGTPGYLFKPLEGESRFRDDWPPGGGAPREILMSQVNDMLKEDVGLDFGIVPTSLVTLTCPSFSRGTKSTATTRTGALQTAIQFKPGDPKDGKELFSPKNMPDDGFYDPERVLERMKSINSEDAQSMAVLDFLTLNGDRHSENLLLQNPGLAPGQTRLIPIDAGQVLPSKATFMRGISSLSCSRPFNPDNPEIRDGENFIMQLPLAQERFDKKTQKAIAKLDPKELAQKMKASYDNLVQSAPNMAGKVGDDSFELVEKSATFLQRAAPILTMYQISQVYAMGFFDIANAQDDRQLAEEIDKAIALVQEYTELGGANSIRQYLRIEPESPPLTIEEQITLLRSAQNPDEGTMAWYDLLRRQLADVGPYLVDSSNAIQQELQGYLHEEVHGPQDLSPQKIQFVQLAASWKKMGGDPMLRTTIAEDTHYQVIVVRSFDNKLRDLPIVVEIMRLGGYAELRRLMGDQAYGNLNAGEANVHLATLKQLLGIT